MAARICKEIAHTGGYRFEVFERSLRVCDELVYIKREISDEEAEMLFTLFSKIAKRAFAHGKRTAQSEMKKALGL